MKIAVIAVPFIRTLEHSIFMEQTINSLRKCSSAETLDLIAIINGVNDNKSALDWINTNFNYVEKNDVNILARAWNKGIKIGFERGADFCLVINLDLLFHPQYIENLISFAKNNQQALLWSGTPWNDQNTLNAAALSGSPQETVDYSAFLIDQRLFKVVGEFDEEFKPAYFEDNDMTYRIKLAGSSVISSASAAFFHFERITIQSSIINNDLDYMRSINAAVVNNSEYYQKKWGGLPRQEKFAKPFGG